MNKYQSLVGPEVIGAGLGRAGYDPIPHDFGWKGGRTI